MKRKFIIFLVLLAVIVGMAGFYYYQKNAYSKESLKLEILGSEEAEGYQEIEYIVKYKNNGNIRLEEPTLTFEYPKFSIVENNILRKEVELEDIYPGQEETLSFKARLIGGEGETRIAKVMLSYRPKNIKPYYKSTTTFTTIIKSVPLNFNFDLPSKIESGKNLKFTLNYYSNIDYPLSNLRVKIKYPFDFEFVESNPQSLEKTEWEILSLNKAEGGRIEILGRIGGGIGEQKIFEAELNTWKEGEEILLKKATKGVEITKPALYITQQINGNPEYIANAGDSLHYEIFFKNIGEEPLTDLFLITTLEGEAFDLETLKAFGGEYNPGDNSIRWEWQRVGDLQFLDVQREGKVEFWVKLKTEWEIPSSEGKALIKNKIYLSQAKEEFVTKVNSKLEISQRGYFRAEVWESSGSIPPKVGQTTTYTIIWQAKNYYNEIKNVKVKATLPKNIKLTGEIFPEEETGKFTFDSDSREIVWDIGDLKVGQGVFNPSPNISFQIAFTPNISQRGKTPKIIGEAEITGEDQWTTQTLEAVAEAINTTLPDDSTVTEEEGIVR